MGNWNISIQGLGSHGSAKWVGDTLTHDPNDVAELAKAFVKELRAKGHNVENACVTHGCKDDLDPYVWATCAQPCGKAGFYTKGSYMNVTCATCGGKISPPTRT